MKSMLRLRVTAILSNVAFIFYACISHLHPVLVLHCILLPLNLLRLVQMQPERMTEQRGKGWPWFRRSAVL